MPAEFPADSVGLVKPQCLPVNQPLTLASGRVLESYDLVYETYGQLNAERSNAILICHALSGDAHAAGYHSQDDKKPGWWNNYIGPGKPIDTNRFYVVSPNNIGGCGGSTGPTSTNPASGKPFGPDFPHLRVRDWVESQRILMDHLNIQQWAAIVGGSLGGMQVMRWSLEYPDAMRHCVVIASSMHLTAQNIAFNETARQAIMSDNDFHDGHYYEKAVVPRLGLSLARMIGHLTYLSDNAMEEKFGRELSSGSFRLGQDSDLEFQVASYLKYQGEKFSTSFDANTYILMTRALDYFDLAREYGGDPVKAFSHANAAFLVISFSTDWRFSPQRSQDITNALIAAGKSVVYTDIESDFGHDAFLLKNPRYEKVFQNYMQHVHQELQAGE
ncbi:Homoserine O-succinyltransferase [BD1-7 clade bacterium]|uniref:Homoserine O-succinyltransferase n=1 Tax=BD1-7 clade bacterium TaxID=2029982 RepID=A0A5S9QF70_9GAMM|nr:Homoserine O-succinyltransferase [BD1-7 clade bacterium]